MAFPKYRTLNLLQRQREAEGRGAVAMASAGAAASAFTGAAASMGVVHLAPRHSDPAEHSWGDPKDPSVTAGPGHPLFEAGCHGYLLCRGGRLAGHPAPLPLCPTVNRGIGDVGIVTLDMQRDVNQEYFSSEISSRVDVLNMSLRGRNVNIF